MIARKFAHRNILKPLPTERSNRAHLVSLLKHANSAVPFYKGKYTEFLRHQGALSDTQFWDEFAKTPITTKQDLKDHNNEFQSKHFGNLYELIRDGAPPSLMSAISHIFIQRNFKVSISTGGTSGIPTYRWLDYSDANVMAQSFLESFHANGWQRGESFIVFYPLQSYFTDSYAQFNNTLDRLFGFSMVPFEDVTLERVQALLKALRERKSTLLVIFPCVLQRVAELMKQNNIPPFEGLKTINVSGEFFMDCSKAFVQEMFPDSRIEITYGAVEVGEVAHQYGPSSFDYQVFSDFARLEEGPDESLLITSLRQKGFPMIRYQMEDKAIVQTDEDGQQYLIQLEGKNTDYLIGADGQRYYTSFFNHMVNMMNEEFGGAIIHFMLRYNEPSMHMNFVLRDPQNKTAARAIENACLSTMMRTFPQFTDVQVHFPDHFDHDYTRKFKIIGEGDGLAEVVGGYYKRKAG